MAAVYYVYVENTDNTFAKALSQGARKIFESTEDPS
jgi:hypothetical protein